jgi:hypothetical protein
MNPKLEEYLIRKFPKLYNHTDECPFNDWKFECNDGWFKLIYWLSAYLQNYIDQNNTWAEKYPSETNKFVEQIKVVQVKEKFATLRYYVSGGDEHTNAVISFVEYISGYVCEYTGKTDDVVQYKKGWIKTLNLELVENSKQVVSVYDEELQNILKEITK